MNLPYRAIEPCFHRLSSLLVAFALAGTVLLTATAAVSGPRSVAAPSKTPKRYTIEQFFATTRISGASFSADEKKILFNSDANGIYNAHTIPTTGGKAEPLTHSTTDSTFSQGYFPNDDRILFSRAKGGDENDHVFVRELDGAERDLTPGEKVKAAIFGWRVDGGAFYVTTNERDPKMFDVYCVDARTYSRTMLYKNEQALLLGAISRDEKWMAFTKSGGRNDSDVVLVTVATGEAKLITSHQGDIAYRAQTFDPQTKRLFFLTDESSEFTRLRTYDLASGATKDVEKADWDIAYSYFSRDGRYRVTGVNQDASVVIRVVEVRGSEEKPVALPKLPGGAIQGVTFSRTGSKMAFLLNGDRSPNNLFVYDFTSRQVKQLTQSLSKDIRPIDLVDAEVVRFKSFDGMVIPGIYYKPHGASPANKVPAIVMVHGGPGGQATRRYSAEIQYLVNNGYAVLDINNRGSSGYGKTFFAADDRKHGREPLWDCVEAKTFLASLGHIDRDRIGIMGGSYGGYMTLSALAFRPEAFKVGVNIFGVSNWIRTLESIPPYWESFRKALYEEIGDPVKDREFLIAASPLFHAKEIRKPLIVIQGANDPRVIKPESDDIVAAVKKNNVPVEYVVFDDEGHGFLKKKNQMEANKRIVEFLDKYLKQKG